MDIRKKNTMDLISGLVSGYYMLTGLTRKVDEYGPEELTAHFFAGTSLGPRRHNYSVFDPSIEKVIFHDPATIVFWEDGTKTVVKCGENDIYDPEKGLAMAIAKKALGNEGNYYNQIKKWLPESGSYGCSDSFADVVERAVDSIGRLAAAFANVESEND